MNNRSALYADDPFTAVISTFGSIKHLRFSKSIAEYCLQFLHPTSVQHDEVCGVF